MQIHAWFTKSSSYSNPWAPNPTLYPFLELEAGSVLPSLNFPQLDCVRPSRGFHPVTWERINPFGYLKLNYGQKKGWESNCQFNSWPLKVRNHLELLVCKWCATYCWKALDKGYNFVLNLISIEGFQKKLWASKVVGVSILRISRLPKTWEFRDKKTIKGKVVASPKSGLWWVL